MTQVHDSRTIQERAVEIAAYIATSADPDVLRQRKDLGDCAAGMVGAGMGVDDAMHETNLILRDHDVQEHVVHEGGLYVGAEHALRMRKGVNG